MSASSEIMHKTCKCIFLNDGNSGNLLSNIKEKTLVECTLIIVQEI